MTYRKVYSLLLLFCISTLVASQAFCLGTRTLVVLMPKSFLQPTMRSKRSYPITLRFGSRVLGGRLMVREHTVLSHKINNIHLFSKRRRFFRGKLTRLKGRPYSLSASFDIHSGRLHLAFIDRRGNNYIANTYINASTVGRYIRVSALLRKAPRRKALDYLYAHNHHNKKTSDDNNLSWSYATTKLKQMDVAIATDEDFRAIHADPLSTIADIVNDADVIYASELGLTFKIVSITRVGESSLNTDVIEDLLTQFKDYGNAKLPQGFDVAHLFSGKDLISTLVGKGVVGLGYVGVVCVSPTFSYSVSEVVTTPALWHITFAHEIGHNLGADHDPNNEGIMSATVSPSLNSFSNFSKNQISSFLASNGSCLKAVENNDSGSDDNQTKSALFILPKVLINKQSTFKAVVRLRKGSANGCILTLYAAKKKKFLSEDKIDTDAVYIFSKSANSSKTVFREKKVSSLLKKKGKVWFAVRHSCSDGTNGVTTPKSILLSKGGKFKKKRWIKKLAKKFAS